MTGILVQTTFATISDAKQCAHALVSAKVAACIAIQPTIQSVYLWNGNIEEENECKLEIKTLAQFQSDVYSIIRSHSSYDCPQLITLPITHISEDYLEWMKQELL